MARPPRIHIPNSVLHVISRGNRRQTIFERPEDWSEFLEKVRSELSICGTEFLAYCLMPNHFHLMLRVHEQSISKCIQSALTSFALRSNKIHDRVGHVFQGRFKAFQCHSDGHAKQLLRYIHRNPVRAGLATAPKDWQWSSHNAYASGISDGFVDLDFLLNLFSQDRESAVRAYNAFMAEEDREGPHGDVPTLDMIASAIERTGGVPLGALRGPHRSRDISRLRAQFIRTAAERGFQGIAISRFLNRNKSCASRAKSATRVSDP